MRLEFKTPFATSGVPAEELRPFELIVVMLWELAVGPSISSPKVRLVAISLQSVKTWSEIKGSGFIVSVTVKGVP